ncbi:amidohydrolase [Leucobacter sp. cx-328]|uniref:amidohydrolase n=1 Tax=unclassified Leucobacter TaxID=2621730 RepID=UPI00165DE9F5|nr:MULTISPECIES: amidohydrolase [unclassified Leucobacter]MBC9943341.1 amidohydrolase [Leucobacter sp. cx-328]
MNVDVLFTGGAVFTGEGDPRTDLAIGISGDRITAIVAANDATRITGPDTKVIDLAGALLSPGFQDAHIHPIGGGVEALQCDLTESENAGDSVRLISEYAVANPDEVWILGAGWSMDHFEGGAPTRDLIDAIVSDRPVVLSSRDHHSVWANTRAIELAGLTAQTADPKDGRIERESDGFPAGTFHEGAMNLFNEVKPESSADLTYRGLLHAQTELIAQGVTGWQDAWVGSDGPGTGTLEAYERAVAEGTLRVHVTGSQWWERDRGLDQIPEIIARRDASVASGTSNRFNLGTVKMMVDGVAENFTASMLDPYLDEHGEHTCNHGIAFIPAEILTDAVQQIDAAGMQVHFHALGDRAVRNALDAVEAARKVNGPSDGRHHLAHLQVIAAEDTARFAEVDAVANLQMLWATHEDQLDTLTLPFMSERAATRQYPFGDLVRDGARLAAGSDWPVSTADPLAAIHIGVTRVGPGITAGPLGGAEQCLALSTAFAAYTSGTAYVNHRDHDTGWIREGYLANLVVIEPNPFALAPADIADAAVTQTWIEGSQAFARAQ